jgi:hypothetical protein
MTSWGIDTQSFLLVHQRRIRELHKEAQALNFVAQVSQSEASLDAVERSQGTASVGQTMHSRLRRILKVVIWPTSSDSTSGGVSR